MHRHSGAFGAVLDVYTEVVTMDADLSSCRRLLRLSVAGVQGRIAIMFGLSSSGAGALPDRFRALRKAPHLTNHVGGGLVPNIRTRSRVNVRGHHAGREDGLVRRAALAQSRSQPTHRGRRLPLGADQHLQRPHRLPLRQRLAHPARRAEPVQYEDQPDQLRLWLAAAERPPVPAQGVRKPKSANRDVPDRRDGLHPAPGRAAGDPG
jgi:hypothetical protein